MAILHAAAAAAEGARHTAVEAALRASIKSDACEMVTDSQLRSLEVSSRGIDDKQHSLRERIGGLSQVRTEITAELTDLEQMLLLSEAKTTSAQQEVQKLHSALAEMEANYKALLLVSQKVTHCVSLSISLS